MEGFRVPSLFRGSARSVNDSFHETSNLSRPLFIPGRLFDRRFAPTHIFRRSRSRVARRVKLDCAPRNVLLRLVYFYAGIKRLGLFDDPLAAFYSDCLVSMTRDVILSLASRWFSWLESSELCDRYRGYAPRIVSNYVSVSRGNIQIHSVAVHESEASRFYSLRGPAG